MSLTNRAIELCQLSGDQLAKQFLHASPLACEDIADSFYQGVSLGLPRIVEKLSWKKFAKVFETCADGQLQGYNIRIEDDGLDMPWRAKQKQGSDWSFGPFQVVFEPDLLLDYGFGRLGMSPLRRLRDPLRRLDSSGDLLLGRSYLQITRSRRVPTPSWFLLERRPQVKRPT